MDSSTPITMKALFDAGAITHVQAGVKILGTVFLPVTSLIRKGSLKKPVAIEVTKATPAAKRLIESAGGSVKEVYFNKLGIRAHVKPEKFVVLPRLAAPPPRLRDRYPNFASQREEHESVRASHLETNRSIYAEMISNSHPENPASE